MLTHKYESAETLSGHTSSVTVLLFSPDGEYLASGCENGVVLVTATTSWEVAKKLVNVSPVTALLWDPTFPMTVVCGFASGAILTVHIGDSDLVRPCSMTVARVIINLSPPSRADRNIKCGQTRLTAPSTVSL